MELFELTARELSTRIAGGALSPVEVMRATLARVAEVNPGLNALVALRDREALMGEARLAEAELRGAGPRGWLHGIPVAIKDQHDVKGLPTAEGAPFLARTKAMSDAPLVARLKAAGAIVIGKTNVPMFMLGGHTVNPVYGATPNPFDRTRTSGGSSGGAGAALAARMLWVADGSDMMGSLRNPAAWNGVWAFRPTPGLIPPEQKRGAPAWGISTTGPMARDMDDLIALLDTMSGGALRGAAEAPRRPRIGWLGDWGGALAMEPGLLDLGEAALARTRDLGWEVEAVAPPVPREMLWDSWTAIRGFAVVQSLGAHWRDEGRRAQLNPQAIWEIETACRLTGEGLMAALAMREAWLDALDGLFARFDALAAPATQLWPFPIGWDWPREIAGQGMDTYHRWMEVVVPASLAGLPSAGMPAGLGPAGLPGGIQLMGPRGGDAAVLSLARAYASVAPVPAAPI